MPDEAQPTASEPAAVRPPTDFETYERESRSRGDTASADDTQAEAKKPSEVAKPKGAAAETAPDSEPDDEGLDSDADASPQKKSGFERRVQKLKARIAALEAEKAQGGNATRPVAAAEAPVAVAAKPAAAAEGEPKSEDFASYELFVKALAAWEFRQLRAAEKAAEKAESERATAKTQQEAHQQRLAAARARHDDYDELVIEGGAQVAISRAMHEVLTTSENGPELAYYLAGHLEDAARIAKLSPFLAAVELGRLESKLAPDEEPETKPAISKAPKPFKPVSTASAGNADGGKEPDPKDFPKWSKWRERQDALNA